MSVSAPAGGVMDIPAEFRVGPFSYRVEMKEHVLTDDGCTVAWAHCSSIHQVIQVQSTMTPERTRCAVLHELLHAIDDAHGNLGLSEEQVTRLGLALGELFALNDMRFLLPEYGKVKA